MTDQLSLDLASLRIDRESPRRRSRWWLGALAAAVLASGGVAALRAAPGLLVATFFPPTVAVTEIATVSPAQGRIELTATGYVVPQIVAKVGTKVTGRVVRVAVREGQRVSAGDVLFELDPADERSALASAQAQAAAARARAAVARAQVAEAKQQAERSRKLAADGAAPAAEAEDAQARVVALEEQVRASDAEARAASAQASVQATGLANLTVRAPVSGTAVTKPAELGDIVNPATVLVELADFASLLVETDVPEAKLGLARQGSPCEVVLDALPNQRLRGEVVELGPRVNRSKATGLVKVKLLEPPELLRPDMSGRVSLLSEALDPAKLKEPPKQIVPAAAVTDRGGGKVVFVLAEGRVRMVPVTLGPTFGTGFELIDGPAPGTRVIKDPAPELGDGTQVKEKSE
ncbi:MAG: efflux RND transporter periplasmic adaptor subunit [Polyangiaceae bacterium]|nr:efflux RND transporter periplasmic adaptor subunit [Polyangiaceae bacterium]